MLRTVVKPTACPVSLDEARLHLRRDDRDDDTTIKELLSAATVHAQNMVQRRFIKQTVEFVVHSWCQGCIHLPTAPVAPADVKSIKYVDLNEVQQTLDPAAYRVQTMGESVRIIPKFGTYWPLVCTHAPEPIVIQFEVGGTADDVPPNVKSAIKLILGHLYENRDAAGEIPQGAYSLMLSETW